MYIYEGHTGGLYASDDILDYEDLYCEECGDSDSLIGYASTKEEAWELLKDNTDIDGSGGWDYEYVQDFIDTYWRKQVAVVVLTKNEINIIKTGIWVAQVECQLPETNESEEIRKLLAKLESLGGDVGGESGKGNKGMETELL